MKVVKSNGYKVLFGSDALGALSSFLSKSGYTSYFILCDENTFLHCLPLLVTSCPKLANAEIIEAESGEASKSLEFCVSIWQTLIENNADRQSLLINLGGGVVSDLGGFAASVYKRGIDFIHVPTSLLAMADASVGGKTGIDFIGIKNSIGSFAQPKGVFIYPDFVLSLSERHFQNGLAEIYKMALISDKKLWSLLNDKGLNTELLVEKSLRLKNKLVMKDPFDKGIRSILNFGHTVGHALEALFLHEPDKMLHGEAVLAGMIIESHVSFQKKMLSKKELAEITGAFASSFTLHDIRDISVEVLVNLIKNDKKTSKTKFHFSLIDEIGSCKFNIEVTEPQIRKALAYYNSLHA